MNGKKTESEKEEFFRIPKAEFIIEQQKSLRPPGGKLLPKELGSLVENESINIPDRMSIHVNDSGMEKSGIHKDNYVIVEKSENYYEGEILAVKFDERILIRRLYNTKGRLRLECDSSNKPTIIVENKIPGFSILGRVIQVIKEL